MTRLIALLAIITLAGCASAPAHNPREISPVTGMDDIVSRIDKTGNAIGHRCYATPQLDAPTTRSECATRTTRMLAATSTWIQTLEGEAFWSVSNSFLSCSMGNVDRINGRSGVIGVNAMLDGYSACMLAETARYR